MAKNSDVVEKRLRTTLELNSGNFAKDFKNVNALLKENQSEVKNTSKELKAFGENTKTLTGSLNALTRQYELQSAKAEVYRTGIEKTTKAYDANIEKRKELSNTLMLANKKYEEAVLLHGKESDAAKSAADEVAKLQKEYDKTSKNLETNEKAIKRYNTGLRNTETELKVTKKAIDNTSTALEKSNNKWLQSAQAIEAYKKKVEGIYNSVTSVGNAMIKGGTLIATGVAGGLKAYGQFGDSLAKVNSIARVSKDDLNSLGQELKQLSNDLVIPINQLAEAEYQALSASVEVGKSMEFLETSSKLAKGGFTDVVKSVDVLTTALNAYGLATEEAGRVSDILITTQNLGKVTVGELADKLGEVIPTAKNAAVNLENVGTSIAVLTSQGVKPAQSITWLNALFNEFSKSGTQVSKVLQEETGKSFKQLADEGKSVSDILLIIDKYSKKTGTSFNDLFGSVEAAKGAMGLLKNEGKTYTETLDQMKKSAGATQEAFEGVANTDMEKARKAMNELVNSFIKLGAASAPILSEVSGAISNLSDTIEDMDEETLAAIANTGKWMLILGGGLKVVGGFTKGLEGVLSVSGKVTKAIGANGGVAGSLSALGGSAKAAVMALNPMTVAIGLLGGGAFLAWHKATEMQKEKQEKLNETLEKTNEILKNGITPDEIGTYELEIGDLQSQMDDLKDFEAALAGARSERDKLFERKLTLEGKMFEGSAEESQAYQRELVGINETIRALDDEIMTLEVSAGDLTDAIKNQHGEVEAAEKKLSAYNKALKNAKDTKALLAKATDEHTKKLAEEYGELMKSKSRVEALGAEYEELSRKEKLSSDEKDRVKEIEKELNIILGDAIVARDAQGNAIGINIKMLDKEAQATLGVAAAAKKRTILAAQAGEAHVKNTKNQVKAVLESLKIEEEARAGRASWNDPRLKDYSKMTQFEIGMDMLSKQHAKENLKEFQAYVDEVERYEEFKRKLDNIDTPIVSSSGGGGGGSASSVAKDLMQEALTSFEQKKKLNQLAMEDEMRVLKEIQKAYAKSTEQKIEMNEYMLDNYLDILERRKAAGKLYYDEELKMLEIARDNYAITESEKIELDNRINEKRLERAYKWIDQEKYYGRLSLQEEKAAYERSLEYAKRNADETEAIKREIYRVEKEILEQEVQAVKEATDRKIKEREREKQAKYDEIDASLKKKLDGYQAELDALDRLEEEERRREREKAHDDKINSLQDKLTGATTDDERNSIIAEMNAENASYEKYLKDEKRKKEREAIREKMELARQEAQAQKEQADKAFKEQVDILTKQQEIFINYLTGKTDGTAVTEQGITSFLTGEYDNRNLLFKNMVDKDIAYLQGAATIMQGIYASMFGGFAGLGKLQMHPYLFLSTLQIDSLSMR